MEIRYLLDKLKLIESEVEQPKDDEVQEPVKAEPVKQEPQTVDKPEHRLAPNRKPSKLNAGQYRMVRTPEFKAWFGDWEHDEHKYQSSEIVGANEEPLVCYRGNVEDFGDTFSYDKQNLTHKSVSNTFGFFFSTDSSDATHYTGDTGNTQAVFLNIRNPLRLRQEYISDMDEFVKLMKTANVSLSSDTLDSIVNYLNGIRSSFDLHDTHKYLTGGGSLLRNDLISSGYDGMMFLENKHEGAIVVAFNPNQVKSAIGNVGFSTKSDKMHEEL
jgi:hypothetical protein